MDGGNTANNAHLEFQEAFYAACMGEEDLLFVDLRRHELSVRSGMPKSWSWEDSFSSCSRVGLTLG